MSGAPHGTRCNGCGKRIDGDYADASPLDHPCEAANERYADGESVDDPACVECCAVGLGATHLDAVLDCHGDCRLIAARERVAA